MQTDKPLVSVVVPVYNARPYLGECLEGLCRQRYANLEIILVDDGSTDGSGPVCDQHAERYPHIQAIHQRNRGVSAARNRGTALARGAYVAFVDADDTVEESYVEALVRAAMRYGAEIAVCGCRLRRGRGEALMNGPEALRALLYQKCFDTAPWGKLFRRELALAEPFPEGMFFEDLAAVCRLFGAAARVACIAENGYHYRATPDGTMRGGDVRRLLDELKAADMMADYVAAQHPQLRQAAESRRFSAYCQVLLKLPEAGYAQERQAIWTRLRSLRRQVLLDDAARGKNRAAALLSYFGEDALRRLWRCKEKQESGVYCCSTGPLARR